MNKHVSFRGPAQSSAVDCSVVTASRCGVATHVAMLVLGFEVSTRCESSGRHPLLQRHTNTSLSSSLCERHCYCLCDAREHHILSSNLLSVFVFRLHALLCFRCSVVDVCFCTCSVRTSLFFPQCSDSYRIFRRALGQATGFCKSKKHASTVSDISDNQQASRVSRSGSQHSQW